MKILQILLMLTLLSLLSGCYVQSLHVFYSKETIVEVPEILGEWELKTEMGSDVREKSITPWRFTEERVETYDESNRFSELEVVYFRINGWLFMDFTAGEPFQDQDFDTNFYWGAGITRVHSLCKVQIDDGKLVLIPPDPEWFTKRFETNSLPELPHIKTKDSNFIFTATTEQWHEFLRKHADTTAVFNPKYRFVLKRKK